MSDIQIRELKKDEYKIWDEIVNISPQATIFHKLDCLETIERYTNSKLHLLIGQLGIETVAAIPFFYKKKKFISTLSSPIKSASIQNLGPIFPNFDDLKQNKRETYLREFQKKLDSYIFQKINPQIINIVTSPNPYLLDARPYLWSGYNVFPKYTYIINLQNLDLVWNGFKSDLRHNIGECEKKGVEIEEGNLESFNIILQSFSERLEKYELELALSHKYYLDLFNILKTNNLKIFIATYNGEMVSGIISTIFKDTISLWIGGARGNIKGIYPVDLLQWKIIKWANENGLKYCENIGANMQKISHFKSRYNFDLKIYYAIEKFSFPYKILSTPSRILKELRSGIVK